MASSRFGPVAAPALAATFEIAERRYTARMHYAVVLVTAVGLAALGAKGGIAQERPAEVPLEASRAEWQAEIKASRERADQMRRERRSFIPQAPTPQEIAAEASRRALEDDSLLPGDIVSTERGLYQFRGALDRERKPDDFVRVR